MGRRTSLASAAGAGIGMVLVSLTYSTADFSSSVRQILAVVTVAVGGLAGASLDAARQPLGRPGAVPGLLLFILATMFLCVPETDQFRVVALAPSVAVLVELASRRCLPIEWLGVVAAWIAWAGAVGASTRESASIGALFAWWPLILVAGFGWRFQLRRAGRPLLVSAIGVLAGAIVARTGALSTDWIDALIAVAIAAPASALVAFAVVETARGAARSTPG